MRRHSQRRVLAPLLRGLWGRLVSGAVLAGAVLTGAASAPGCAPEELAYGPPAAGGAGADAAAGDSAASDAAGWAEVCGNGLDDDNNGKADCEEEVCAGLACVDVAPAGWTGPVALFTGADGNVPVCPDGLDSVFEGKTDLSFRAATCSGCSCGTPTSLICTASIATSQNTIAPCNLGLVSSTATENCTPIPAAQAIQVNGFSASGTCGAGPAPTTVTKDPVAFDEGVRACASSQNFGSAGCESGKVCAPAASTALPCVIQSGDIECPAQYPRRRVVYASTDDSRGCGNCQCSFSGNCSGAVTGYALAGCTSAVANVSTGCVESAAASAVKVVNVSHTGGCSSSGAPPTGCVAPKDASTVCCAASSGPACPVGRGPAMVETGSGNSAYCVDSTEVTKAQYAAFLADGSPPTQPAHCAWNLSFTPTSAWPAAPNASDAPVTYVDWCDAWAFCAWAGKRLCGAVGGGAEPYAKSGNSKPAPDSQWFRACSKDGSQNYPYGPTAVPGVCATSSALKPVKADPCCHGGVSGAYDLVGNAKEWVDSCEQSQGQNDKCVARGQSDCSDGDTYDRDRTRADTGFRCCAP